MAKALARATTVGDLAGAIPVRTEEASIITELRAGSLVVERVEQVNDLMLLQVAVAVGADASGRSRSASSLGRVTR